MEHDFLIIGGGIAGLSAAARLAAHGKVLVLEAEGHIAHHASGRSAALFEPRYGLAPVVELSMASADEFHSLPGILSPRGVMLVGRADQAAQMDHDIASFQLDRISADQARAMVPVLNDKVTIAAFGDHAHGHRHRSSVAGPCQRPCASWRHFAHQCTGHGNRQSSGWLARQHRPR